MKNNKITNLEGMSYETPSVTSLDILSEGLLCQSGEFKLNDWEQGQNNWFENE